jgi:hypothetical protein
MFREVVEMTSQSLAAVYFAPKVSSAPSEILARTDDTVNTPAANPSIFSLRPCFPVWFVPIELSGVRGILQ